MNMSRSYHVTEKQARAAFARGDIEPTVLVSEKSWVKKKELIARPATTVADGFKVAINRAIVAREKKRTAASISAVVYRKQNRVCASKK